MLCRTGYNSVNEYVCNSCGATRGQEGQIYPKIIKGFLIHNLLDYLSIVIRPSTEGFDGYTQISLSLTTTTTKDLLLNIYFLNALISTIAFDALRSTNPLTRY